MEMSTTKPTLEQVHKIISNHLSTEATVSSFLPVSNNGYSYTTRTSSYCIQLAPESIPSGVSASEKSLSTSYILIISYPLPESPSKGADPSPSLTISTISKLITLISTSTSVPIPRLRVYDTSLEDKDIPFHWMLLDIPTITAVFPGQPDLATVPLSTVRELGILTPRQDALIDVRIGIHLKQLHGLQNVYFGIPDSPFSSIDTATTPSFDIPGLSEVLGGVEGFSFDDDLTQYSWQDTFTLLLDGLLDEISLQPQAELDSPHIPDVRGYIPAIRAHLTRAMGSFLFDDVEIPSLVWTTCSEDDIFIAVPQVWTNASQTSNSSPSYALFDPSIAYILPTFAHVLWGDPLLEALFMPPRPSWAFAQGYTSGSVDAALGDQPADADGAASSNTSIGACDHPLIIFPRQRTKRIWYTLYLALLVLNEHALENRDQQGHCENQPGYAKVLWARDTVTECVGALKDAPCY